MRNLTKGEYSIFQKILSLSQNGLLKTMEQYLVRKGYTEIVATKDYLYAVGDIPISLVAHLDTVFPHPPKDIYYDKNKNVMWSPDGLGADDRAGVFAIIKILKKGYKPHIILTTNEEQGCLGAMTFVDNVPEPFADMKYIIQLDRRGVYDCVFYDCDSKVFETYIESFGFVKDTGSFSDISIICPYWGVAGVNLSIGYLNEHSVSETFHITPFLLTVDKVINMLEQAENASYFNYIQSKNTFNWKTIFGNEVNCYHCKKPFSNYELIPVKCADKITRFYCPDCIVDNVNWCMVCGEAFEATEGQNDSFICEKCLEEVTTDGRD